MSDPSGGASSPIPSTQPTDAHPRQLTVRAILAGALLGGVMSLSNLYVALKSGWSFGVSITAGILAFAIFALLLRVRLIRREFGILENNAMQSVASAAGYMTGGGTVAAIPALMMITGRPMDGWTMFFWITTIAMLGVVMAIPMKQQMINVEQLRFPTGTAAAETLRALHGDGRDGHDKARWLGWGAATGALVAVLRDAPVAWTKWLTTALPDLPLSWLNWRLPGKLPVFPFNLRGRPFYDYTLSLECGLILVGAGMIMGFRAAWSMLLGAGVNFGVFAPWLYEHGIIEPRLGYAAIVKWSVWFGSAMILTSGLLSFAFQWRTVVRAVKSVSAAFGGPQTVAEIAEVPMKWFFFGVLVLAPVVVFLEWFLFGIHWWLGIVSVVLGFFIAIVACRATGETDTTPTGALGKITQVTFGVLDPGNTTTNLMTANVTGGVGIHAADLLTDLKSGYLLKADPRQQFWAQFLGVMAGSLFVVPAYRLLIPTADMIGTDQWPAPGAQTWMGAAQLLAKGWASLHVTAQWAILVGGVLGVGLVLLERFFPKARPYIPSAAAFGLGFTTPGYNTIAIFLGALIAVVLEKARPKFAERTVVPVGSGLIAGESIVGVFFAAWAARAILFH